VSVERQISFEQKGTPRRECKQKGRCLHVSESLIKDDCIGGEVHRIWLRLKAESSVGSDDYGAALCPDRRSGPVNRRSRLGESAIRLGESSKN
jgi:hypothetical protein